MSYIMNVREKDRTDFSGNKEGRNAYYEGYLDDDDSALAIGYDLAIEDMMTAFYNLMADEEDFSAAGFNVNDIQEEVLSDDEDNDKTLDEYTVEERMKMTKETKLVIAFRNFLSSYMELDRNELISSMIEGMDRDEYDRMVALDDAGKKNRFLRFMEEKDKRDAYYESLREDEEEDD